MSYTWPEMNPSILIQDPPAIAAGFFVIVVSSVGLYVTTFTKDVDPRLVKTAL